MGLQGQHQACVHDFCPQLTAILLLITQKETTERWGFGVLVHSGAINHHLSKPPDLRGYKGWLLAMARGIITVMICHVMLPFG